MKYLEFAVNLIETLFTIDNLVLTMWGLLVAFMALLTGLLVTQFFKFTLPKIWKHKTKTMLVRTLASVMSFMMAVFLWPEPMGIAAGFLALLAAPWSYRLITGLLYRKWPDLEKLLSMEADE